MFGTGKEPGGTLTKVDQFKPGERIMIYAMVEGVDQTLAKAKKLDGKMVKKKTEIPDIGWYGLFSDLDGNILSVSQGK